MFRNVGQALARVRAVATKGAPVHTCSAARRLSTSRAVSGLPDLKFLVVDGYTKEGREGLRAGGATEAGVLYERMLQRWAPKPAQCDIVYPADPDFDDPDVMAYDGVAWTGSSLCAHSGAETSVKQIAFAKAILEGGPPGFGSCFAIQVAAVAQRGVCQTNPRGREMGLARKIKLTDEGRAHPMYEGKPTVFDAFTSHEDEVTHLGPGSTSLCGNAWSSVQALHCALPHGGVFWGVQYHPEYDLHELARLTSARTEKLIGMGFFRDKEAVDSYVADLEALHADPSRKDLAWKLGFDADVMDETVRCIEVRNWIHKIVMPYHRQRFDVE